VRTRPTVAELEVLGESVLIDLRRLLSFNGSWERPSVHRLLKLLYRTLPLVQLGPAIFELSFERFHQLAKRDVSQNNSCNPAGYAIQRWRDTQQYSRVLSFPGEYVIPAAWLLGRRGKQLKAVSLYSLGPTRGNTATVNDAWSAMHSVRTLLGSTEDVWEAPCAQRGPHTVAEGHEERATYYHWIRVQYPLLTLYLKNPTLEQAT